MLTKLNSLISSIEDGLIKEKIISLAEGIRPKDHLRIDIRELEGLIDPEKVAPLEPMGRIEIKL
jgi:hypothetical protein